MNSYLIPANAKKGQLIFNMFRWIDLILLLVGAFMTLILVFAIKKDTILLMALKLLPIGVAVLLVMPVPYYHNVLVFLTEMFKYFTSQNIFKWKGWCATYDSGEQE